MANLGPQFIDVTHFSDGELDRLLQGGKPAARSEDSASSSGGFSPIPEILEVAIQFLADRAGAESAEVMRAYLTGNTAVCGQVQKLYWFGFSVLAEDAKDLEKGGQE